MKDEEVAKQFVVLVYSGVGYFQCAVGPFDDEKEAKDFARTAQRGMDQVVQLYPKGTKR